ncbi:Alpha/beta hydrolase family protein [Tranquillimonas rosea]|uniref:Alpha/beta hydrolase family protein n=1 Tax=Tranquillimonas rosea TaxID=641238 RepID=A0A1H9TEW9_9RHOB|nr:CocE/NonD family hydrolase [Tranquillimonas rosea]SER95732.1 Alpha/beta hydrolase family protein [Tranquillimonas rosea]
MNTKASSEPPALPGFIDRRRRALPLDLSFARRRGQVADWRAAVLAAWRDLLPPHDAPPEGEAHGERVRLTYATGAEAEGRLILPDGPGPHPGLLLLHDHGGRFDDGHARMFADGPGADARARFYGGAAPAEVLRAAGFAVLCLDAIGFGGRWHGGYEGQQRLAAALSGLGWSLAGVTAAEDAQAARWLAEHPAVDAARVGAFGFSFGGFRAWQAAALCPALGAVASAGWMACRADLMRPGAPLLAGHSAFHFLHPGLSHRADFPDLAGLSRAPLFLRSGRGDRHMPEDSVAAAWAQIAAIRAAAGDTAPDNAFHPHGHTCPPDVLHDAAAFLRAHLG